MEITELMKEAIENVRKVLDVNTVIGKPIVNCETTVIPITRMSIGFVSGGGELEGKSVTKNKELPVGGVGGGANIAPIGFLIMDGINVKYIKTDGGDKIGECVENILDFLVK